MIAPGFNKQDLERQSVERLYKYTYRIDAKLHNILTFSRDGETVQRILECLDQNDIPSRTVSRSQELMQILKDGRFTLVVLDLESDGGGDKGLDLIREIRVRSDIPIIAIARQINAEIDTVVALELGADDCLVKPLKAHEFLARLRAVLRRGKLDIVAWKAGRLGLCRFGNWLFDRSSRRLTTCSGKLVRLTKGEYELLDAFVQAPLRALTREYLLDATNKESGIIDRSLDVKVLRLRRKLEENSKDVRAIETIRGIGYMFALQVSIDF
jgi:two-component system, OmpR family, response regulator